MTRLLRRQPFIKGKCFYNNPDEKPENFLLHTLPSFAQALAYRIYVPKYDKNVWIHNGATVQPNSYEPVITWIGHATFLIQVGGINIITDPVFGEVSRFFKRVLPAGIAVENLPKIDIVLLSHNHPDHTNLPSLYELKKNNPDLLILTPVGDKLWLNAAGFDKVNEYNWWQVYMHRAEERVAFTFLPAVHWSQRTFFDRNQSLWGSWMITYDRNSIYFAGDTAYSSHFLEIAQEFSHISIALMPIGPCNPDPWMRRTHVDAREAVRGFNELGATHFVPMHWGTFPFGTDRFDTPIKNLHIYWDKFTLETSPQRLHVIPVGKPLTF